jgi:Tol biopolymer transport system component
MPALRVPAAAVLLAALAVPAAPAVDARAAFPGGDGLIAAEAPRGGARPIILRRPGGAIVRRVAPGARDPAFSPRGLRLAVARRGDLLVVPARGGGPRAVTAGPAPDGEPAWSPGGDTLVFASGPPGARDLFRVRADGSARQRLTFRAADDGEPAWSARDEIAFVRRAPARAAGRARGGAIFVLTPSTWTVRRLSPRGSDDAAPAWSPDGRRLAFTRPWRGSREIHVMRADGSGVERVTALGQNAGAPAWSPDGRRIVFTAGAPGRRRLLVMRAGGRAVRAIGRTALGAAPDWQPAGLDPVIAAAGDVACDPSDPAFAGGAGTIDRCRARQTYDLLLTMDLAAVLVLGDAQEADGRLAAYRNAFDATWGRLGGLLRPVLGNHDYGTPDAAGYFDYFGARAGTRGEGWYSFDVGAWHVVALNSQCGPQGARATGTVCAPGSPQERWLRADLAAHPHGCTLAVFHHPRFSSGTPGRDEAVLPLWQALYDGGADVVLNGHDHAYERFAPQDPAGALDPVHGVREFVAGTGGHSHQRSTFPEPNTELRDAIDFGVLRLTLRPAGYDWAFVAEGGVIVDSGTGACHAAPSSRS